MKKLAHDQIPRPDPSELASLPKHPIVVLVDDVRSAYNVGSIFRTADAARVAEIVLCGISPTPEHRSVRKTALGAEETVAWRHAPDALAELDALRARGYTVAALEITDAPTAPEAALFEHFPLCLVLGNEVTGVQDAVLDAADLAFEIPQYGAKQSLNVSVAFGVAVFDLVRRYRRLALSSPA